MNYFKNAYSQMQCEFHYHIPTYHGNYTNVPTETINVGYTNKAKISITKFLTPCN